MAARKIARHEALPTLISRRGAQPGGIVSRTIRTGTGRKGPAQKGFRVRTMDRDRNDGRCRLPPANPNHRHLTNDLQHPPPWMPRVLLQRTPSPATG